ncbi:MAG TPA: transglutaminase-like cysteine peptidase [Stellaceae bacterium]|nr:transglutaminase-like cysteine peptidase [Stellaceae bacterium]
MVASRHIGIALAAIVGVLALAAPARASYDPSSVSGAPQLYGSTAVFSRDLDAFPQWRDVMKRADAERGDGQICSASHETGCVPAEWHDLIAELRHLPLMAKLQTVNAAINQHPYVTTWQNWHRVMYWESPLEFLRRGGQCQDYAIAKYLALREAGVGDDTIRMLVPHVTSLDVDHAVLAADVDGQSYLLDNLNPAIVPASQVTDYRPYYAISASGFWAYFGGRSMLAQTRTYRW